MVYVPAGKTFNVISIYEQILFNFMSLSMMSCSWTFYWFVQVSQFIDVFDSSLALNWIQIIVTFFMEA